MNILFIASSNNPFSATQGSSQRSNLLLQACSQFAEVDVISFCTEAEQANGNYQIVYQSILPTDKKEGRLKKFSHLLTPWIPNTLYHIDHRKEQKIDDIVANKKYDYIVIRYIPQAISCGLMKYAKRLIIDIDDNPVDKAKNESITARNRRNRIYLRLYAFVMKIGLKAVVSNVNNVFFSNANQANQWKKPFLPNVPFYSSMDSQKSENEVYGRLLFVGDLGYSINQQGISHFLQNIYPIIRSQHPEVTLHLVGRIWDDNLKQKWESYAGVTVTGFVPSLAEEYAQCQVVIIPIYQGVGTCIKVLEAMQMHKPLVTTSIGFRGYNVFFNKDEDCYVADNDSAFAKYTEKLLANEQLRETISKSAFVKQQQFFTKENFNRIVKETIL